MKLKSNEMDLGIKLKRLEIDTEIKPFESEDEDLNNFLLNDAKNYLIEKLAVTYVFESDTETVAYFCLSNDSLRREVDMKTWKKINRQVPNQKRKGVYPAVKIGRLAVSKKYAGNGFGKLMLRYVEKMHLTNDQKTGCRFITVDAYGGSVDFYLHNGYKFFTEKDIEKNTRIMYFDPMSFS
jgi:GNAT superfamily N-acetyltransferase